MNNGVLSVAGVIVIGIGLVMALFGISTEPCAGCCPEPTSNCLIESLPYGYNVYANERARLAIKDIPGVEHHENFSGRFDHCYIEISPRYDTNEVLQAIRQACEGEE